MSFELKSSAKAKKEINKFKKEIENIKFVKAKEKASGLLEELIKKINIIEYNHTFQINRSVDPKKLRDDIEDLVKIRVELSKLIHDSKN
jgi:hypothetical protein